MEPLKGIVIQSGRIARIRLSSGGIIEIQNRPDLERGASVEIDWDYTKDRARNVWLKGKRPRMAEPVGEEAEVQDELIDDAFTPHGPKTITHALLGVDDEEEQDLHFPDFGG